MSDGDELEAGARELGLELQSRQVEQLLQFAALLRRWNAAFNLVSRRDVPRLIARHLLDSLSLAPLLRGGRVLDLGTGAGLPGVPLAIVRPDIEFTLLDRSERRIRFVQQAKFEIGLANVATIVTDIVEFRAGALFATVVSRAVAKPAALWRIAGAVLEPGGQALFQTGALEKDVASVEATVEQMVLRIPGLARPHHLLRVTHGSAAPKDAD